MTDSIFPSTPIQPDEWRGGKYFFKEAEFPLKYSWDGGIAVSRFLQGLKEGKILGTRCFRCKRTLVPPRAFCERCFRQTDEWVEVKDTGRVNTYSVSYVNSDASRRTEPLIVAVIEIDGASPGMGFLHVIKKTNPSKVHIGTKVRAVWKDVSERVGSILDISHFEVLG